MPSTAWAGSYKNINTANQLSHLIQLSAMYVSSCLLHPVFPK